MNILIGTIIYLLIGSIFTIYCEEKGYIDVYGGFGYVIFSILWLLLAIVYTPIIVWGVIKRKRGL